MKKSFLAILAVVLLIAISAGSVYAYDGADYWNEGKRSQTRSGWMDWLPNNRRVSDLSLPGTHDSMAFGENLTGRDITRTQTASLREQLMSGIRVIDIRVNYDNDHSLTCYHGSANLGYNFEDVLSTVKQFLQENPTESVFMRLKQENSSVSDSKMEQAFKYYYNRYYQIFYRGYSQNPTVGEIRGKLVLLSDVWSLNQYGISYRNINKQDSYHLGTNWDLYSKWEKIKNQINRSNAKADSTIYMNYLSGSGGSMPYFVASGKTAPQTNAPQLSTGLTHPGFAHYYPDFPRGSWFLCFATIYFQGTNTLTSDYLVNNNIRYCGMVMADFPGRRLINNIIQCNLR